MTKPSGAGKDGQSLSRMKVSILFGVKYLLAAIEWDASAPGIHDDFFNKVCSMQLNGLFLTFPLVKF